MMKFTCLYLNLITLSQVGTTYRFNALPISCYGCNISSVIKNPLFKDGMITVTPQLLLFRVLVDVYRKEIFGGCVDSKPCLSSNE